MQNYEAKDHKLLQLTIISHAIKGTKSGNWNWK